MEVDTIYLARLDSYHRPIKNCRDDLIIETGRGEPKERPALPALVGIPDAELTVSLFSGYEKFLAA